jgi:hypothetical protein
VTKTVECPGQKLRVDGKTGQVTIQDQPPVQIPLNLIRINDLAFAGVGGAVYTEIFDKFKAASPLPNTVMITMTSGAVGYILPDSSYEHPGHNAASSPLKPGCAEKAIVSGLVDMVRGQQ